PPQRADGSEARWYRRGTTRVRGDLRGQLTELLWSAEGGSLTSEVQSQRLAIARITSSTTTPAATPITTARLRPDRPVIASRARSTAATGGPASTLAGGFDGA